MYTASIFGKQLSFNADSLEMAALMIAKELLKKGAVNDTAVVSSSSSARVYKITRLKEDTRIEAQDF